MSLAQSTKKHDAGKIPGPWNCPQTVEIRVQLTLPNGKLTFFALHGAFTGTAPNIATIATALTTAFSSAWVTNMAPLCPPQTLFNFVSCRDMTSFANPVFAGAPTNAPGSSASVALPVSVAAVITEEINARGRGMKGRFYLGGFATNADGGGGQIASGALAATPIQSFATALFNAIQGQSLTPAVAQPPRNAYLGVTGTAHPQRGSTNPNTGTHVAVNSYTLQDLRWDTQRRRIQA